MAIQWKRLVAKHFGADAPQPLTAPELAARLGVDSAVVRVMAARFGAKARNRPRRAAANAGPADPVRLLHWRQLRRLGFTFRSIAALDGTVGRVAVRDALVRHRNWPESAA